MMNLKTVNLKEIYRTKEKKRTENNKQKLQAKKNESVTRKLKLIHAYFNICTLQWEKQEVSRQIAWI